MTLAAATLAEGPLGLKGLHTVNGVTLNDTSDGYPRYKLTRITGLRDRPDADDNRAPNTGRVGESPYPSLMRGKTVVMEGVIQAVDPITAETAKTALLGAFLSNDATTIVHEPPSSRGGVEWTAFIRILGFTCDDDFSYSPWAMPSPWQANFAFTYRMHHPWFYETTDPQTETGATGLTCVNAGTAPTEPTITVTHSAGNDIVVSNATLGFDIKFDDLPGGDLIISFIARTAEIAGISQVDKLDDVVTTWWDEGAAGLAPGSNTINCTGASGDITVEWFDTIG